MKKKETPKEERQKVVLTEAAMRKASLMVMVAAAIGPNIIDRRSQFSDVDLLISIAESVVDKILIICQDEQS